MLNLSDTGLQEDIRSFAASSDVSPREAAFLLKGNTKLLPNNLLSNLPVWTGAFKTTNFNLIYNTVLEILGQDSELYLKNGYKIRSVLNQDISSVLNLQKTQVEKVKKEVGSTIFKLLFDMMPDSYEERVIPAGAFDIKPGEFATVEGTITGWKRPGSPKSPWTALIKCPNFTVKVVFFGKSGVSYSISLPEGTKVIVSGKTDPKSLFPSFTNPDMFIYDDVWKALFSGYVPVYKKITGVSRLFLMRLIRELLIFVSKEGEDWLPFSLRNRWNLPDLVESLLNVHFPLMTLPLESVMEYKTSYHKRIAFDKLFFLRYGFAKYNRKNIVVKERKIKINSSAAKDALSKIPFELTNAQKRVIKEIRDDLISKYPMNRLLQGDVGSGKTLCMLITGLDVVSSGYKTVIMSPTEILASQHYDTIKKYSSPEIKVLLLKGGVTGKKKKAEMIKEAQNADFIVGTHALYENLPEMEKIGLIIIDEQHRFGVSQRLRLKNVAQNPDVLVVSATPIPRSLAMTLYGDLTISVINEMPKGRTPVTTRFVPNANRQTVVNYIAEIVKKGKKGYVVCPLVEESEKMEGVKDVEAVFAEYKELVGEKVKLLHGKMKNEEKEEALKSLRDGTISLLISTVVIEVGVDVQDASFIVIENAERFGLAQLHQLRGRVGRGDIKSFAAFIGGENISEQAAERLTFMTKTSDGFKIAEYDMRKRGPGAFTGYEQSGFKNDIYFNLAAKYGDEIQRAASAVKWLDKSMNKSEISFIDSLFELFFKEHIERYFTG